MTSGTTTGASVALLARREESTPRPGMTFWSMNMKKDVQFERFTLTERHVKLLRHANVHFCEWAEWGSPSVDCKRPFGNRDMIGDMAEILEIVPVETDDGEKNWPPGTTEQMESLYRELATALQIVLTAGTFVPAVYETERYMPKWRPVAELRESR